MQVVAYIFGSVPLKTYLPDGDIDLALFQSKGQPLGQSWLDTLESFLKAEQSAGHADFIIKDVLVIKAEVCHLSFEATLMLAQGLSVWGVSDYCLHAQKGLGNTHSDVARNCRSSC